MREKIVAEATSPYRIDPKANTATINKGSELMAWRKVHKIPRPLFAEMADCSERSLASYEKCGELPEKAQRAIKETVRLAIALLELVGDEKALKHWLQKPNPAFEGQPPLALLKAGEADRLWEMVFQLRAGAFA